MDYQNYDDIFNRNNYPLFSTASFLPQDARPCVCLSRKQYKDCCKDAIDKAIDIIKTNPKLVTEELTLLYTQKDDKLKSYRIADKSVKKKNISYCSAYKVFGYCDTANSIRYSHTLSKGNVLRNLSDGDPLIHFNDHKVSYLDKKFEEHIIDYYDDIEIEDASVTVSFCRDHDEKLFADIEKDGKTEYLGTSMQNLEYALKAITFDIYYKVMNIRYMAELVKEKQFVVYELDGSYSTYFKDYHILIETLFRLYPLMLKMLEELKQLKEKSIEPELKTVCFGLPVDRINFSLSEVIYLDDLLSFEDIPCYINVVNSKKPYIIVSYYYDRDLIFRIDKLKHQFESAKILDKSGQLMCIHDFTIELLANAQNVYFNKTAFCRLADGAKIYLYLLHRGELNHFSIEKQTIYEEQIFEFLYNL